MDINRTLTLNTSEMSDCVAYIAQFQLWCIAKALHDVYKRKRKMHIKRKGETCV